MSKHELNLTAAPSTDAELERCVEHVMVAYMAQNDGKMPTIQRINAEVRTSNSRLCPMVRAVKARLMATQTKLASMPNIPEELSLVHEQALKEMWAKAREFQNEEIVDLKRSQSAKDAMYREEVAEMQAVIEDIEATGKVAVLRAEAAEKDLADTQTALADTQAALIAVEARCTEQERIFEVLALNLPLAATEEPTKTPTRKLRKSGPSAAKLDEPETMDLPGVNPPADVDAADPS
jgi:hypothetical protein